MVEVVCFGLVLFICFANNLLRKHGQVPRAPIGEADLKFRAAILEGKSLAADAIDGDFVPIGLLAAGEAQVSRCA